MVARNTTSKSLFAPLPEETWSPAERAAWAIPEKIRPSQCAERHRVLYTSDLKGPWRNDNAPYLRGLMDIFITPGCVQLNVEKCAQIGVSEALRNDILYFAKYDPCPVGFTLPDRNKGRKIIKREILPLFHRTEALRSLIGGTRDALIETIELLNGFKLDLMWSGSANATASTPYRIVFNDEVDKYEEWGGDEPDPIGRTASRGRTFRDRRRQINVSTPTTPTGRIHQLLLGSSFILYFFVPCLHCGTYQRLIFDPSHFKWKVPDGYPKPASKEELADLLSIHRDEWVWYECDHCHGKIFNEQKAAMIRQGKWTTESGTVVDYWGEEHDDAEKVTRWPNETRIGMQISALYCLWEHWGKIASDFLRCEGNMAKSYNFRTETLGAPFENILSKVNSNVFSGKCQRATLPANVVPRWAWALLATIDTQADHFYVVVRAWGSGLKSQRVYHGKLMTFEELDRLIFHQSWPVENDEFPPMMIQLAMIDSGGTRDLFLSTSRTQQVYDFVLPRQPIVRALKGASRPGPGLYWSMSRVNSVRDGQRSSDPYADLRGVMVDTNRCNDVLAQYIQAGTPKSNDREEARPDQAEQWLLNQLDDDEYNHHLAAMIKAPERKGAGMVEIWKPLHSGARVDYRHCEAYQIAAAYMEYLHVLPPEAELIISKQRDAAQRQTKKQNTETVSRPSSDWSTGPL
jgi:phage terminase large subunit GpA-like protein